MPQRSLFFAAVSEGAGNAVTHVERQAEAFSFGGFNCSFAQHGIFPAYGNIIVRGEYRLQAFGLAELFQDCENTVTDDMMVVEGIRLRNDHIGEIAVKCISPQIADELRTLGICSDIMPMVRHFDPEIPGAAMYREPSLMCLVVLTVFNEVVASAERSEAFLAYRFLQLYPAAEI